MKPSTSQEPGWLAQAGGKAAFLRRLGYYLAGIAIGLVLLGLVAQARRSAASNPAPAANAK